MHLGLRLFHRREVDSRNFSSQQVHFMVQKLNLHLQLVELEHNLLFVIFLVGQSSPEKQFHLTIYFYGIQIMGLARADAPSV